MASYREENPDKNKFMSPVHRHVVTVSVVATQTYKTFH
jgi:hypothetical protein